MCSCLYKYVQLPIDNYQLQIKLGHNRLQYACFVISNTTEISLFAICFDINTIQMIRDYKKTYVDKKKTDNIVAEKNPKDSSNNVLQYIIMHTTD